MSDSEEETDLPVPTTSQETEMSGQDASKPWSFGNVVEVLGEHGPKLVPETVKTIDIALSSYLKFIYYKCGGSKVLLSNTYQQMLGQHEMKKIAAAFENMDPEDTIPSPLELSVPIMEQLGYTVDEHLSDLLVQLLVASASKKKGKFAHPSMINVARNISPDEALLLKSFAPGNDKARAMISVKYTNTRPEMRNIYTIHAKYFCSSLTDIVGLARPEDMEFYIGNLLSLGLFSYTDGFVPEEDDQGVSSPHSDYEKLESEAQEKFKDDASGPGWSFSPQRYVFDLTDKGKMIVALLHQVIGEKSLATVEAA